MYNSNKILAIVPARGGSKGITRKNLRKIKNRSLIGWVGRVVSSAECIDRIAVSTDDEEIAKEAERYGISAPFRRPAMLSGDFIADIDVLKHGLETIEAIDSVKYDVVLMLQPTSPFRRAKHINDSVRTLVDGKHQAVWTVSETDSKAHPLKQLLIDEEGRLSYYDPEGAEIIARQQLHPVYHRNGLVYALTRDTILVEEKLLPEDAVAIVIRDPVVNIDTEEELELAERRMTKE